MRARQAALAAFMLAALVACRRAPPRPQLLTRTWKDGQEYVFVPAGSFEMGCVPGDRDCTPDELPRHHVTLAQGFWMGRTEVTIGVYDRYAKEHQLKAPMVPWGRPKGGERLAAAAVSWEEATAFCDAHWARLPTEAQWEYAARGGHDGWKYVWAADGPPVRGGRPLANVMDLAAMREEDLPAMTEGFEDYDDGFAIVSPVGTFPANDFGLYDMDGNVNEWCQDAWDMSYQGAPVDGSARASGRGFRVLRGGSWMTGRRDARISSRSQHGFGTVMSGFRCVFDPD